MASINGNRDCFISEQESTLLVGTIKEHAKDSEDKEWECSQAKIKDRMRNSDKSVAEGTPSLATCKEHAKMAADSEWDKSMRNSGKSVDDSSPLIDTAKDNLNAGKKEGESKALTQKEVEATQATDEEGDCSAKKIFLDKTRVHIACSNAENPVAASGGNLLHMRILNPYTQRVPVKNAILII